MTCGAYEAAISTNRFQLGAMAGQMFFSVLAIATNLRLLAFSFKIIYYHDNFKTFVRSLVVFNMVHCVLVITLLSFHLISWALLPPCDAVVPAFVCVAFRLPIIFSYVMDSLLQFGMAVERAIATIRKETYADCSSFTGYVLVGFLSFVGLSLAGFCLRKYPFGTYLIYCSGASETTLEDAGRMNRIITGVIIFTFFFTIALFVYNIRQLRKRTYDSLKRKSQLTENVTTLKLLLPLFSFHLVFFVVFSLVAGILDYFRESLDPIDHRGLVSAVYLIPVYNFLSPIVVQEILRYCNRNRRQKLTDVRKTNHNENDVYFDMYHQLWK
ncbi:unnamed protein product [Caenorhabditis auriculariae]|uniref:G-protein coupled receptors family 1 profile domain-containing protein n=1 Tax=Caenorhabditis auriculariae TaxID=2777116 RepID=A0A8S1HBD0_9PELO|nr:unnamed protein product [Caenorhabditis auriculariae]